MRKCAAIAALLGCLLLSFRFSLVVWLDGYVRHTLAAQALSSSDALRKKAAEPRLAIRGKYLPKILYAKDGVPAPAPALSSAPLARPLFRFSAENRRILSVLPLALLRAPPARFPAL